MSPLVKVINSSKILSSLFCLILRIKNRYYVKEVSQRASADIFDYHSIARPLPKYYSEILTDNNCFGIGYSLRQYAGIRKSYCDALIEHGYFFGDYVSDQEKITFAKQILTFGDIRVQHLREKAGIDNAVAIGPYIHYAKPYYDEVKMLEEKKRLGKVLLVFFQHSATDCSVSFDVDYIISKIDSIKDKFDTVVISLFWSDINPEIEARLKKENYLIFSSGHRYDYNFLSRQKTMIMLSDMTMSNSVGTHIAYCTYLGKPHWLIKQEVKEVANSKLGMANRIIDQGIDANPIAIKEKNDFYESFAEYSDILTDQQITIASKYFGFKHIKTGEQIRKLIL